MKRVVGACVIVGAVLTMPAFAAAQTAESAAASAQAEALFQRGRDLFDKKQTAEACEAFAASQSIEPKLGTLLNLAVCHEELGLVASAWGEFTTAATEAGREGQTDRETFARERIAALEPRLPMLRVTLPPSAPPGTTTKLDGRPFPVTSAPLPIDRGDHAIEVTAPGYERWSRSFQVRTDGEKVSLEVPELVRTAKEPEGAVSPAGPGPATTKAPASGGWGSPVLAIVGFSAGGAGLLIGSITGGVSLAQTGDLKDACVGGCPASAADDLSNANTLANVSNVSFVLGGLGVALGVVGIVIAAPGDESSPVALEPVVGPGYVGLNGRF